MRTNIPYKPEPLPRLAGGQGTPAARYLPINQLRRLTLANLLWESNAYVDGAEVVQSIRELVPRCPAREVAELAIEARSVQQLRHVPLLLCRELLRHPERASHRNLIARTITEVIQRPDEIAELVSLYWQSNGGKKSLPRALKRGLAAAFDKFDEYQFAKWDRRAIVRLRDVMFLVHPKPSAVKQDLYKRIANDALPPADTWEVALSTGQNKREAWELLLVTRRLPDGALLKNLRNMREAGVDRSLILHGLDSMRGKRLLPIDFLRAAKAAPEWEEQLERTMYRVLANRPKLHGRTLLIVDVSGSMSCRLSSKSEFTRMDAACAMAILARELCEDIEVYTTAGNDGLRIHSTALIPSRRGFALAERIKESPHKDGIGGGGIFTRQCLDWLRPQEKDVHRIIVLSDSQDMEWSGAKPEPFGRYNYICDLSCHRYGIAYQGVWTAEVNGWSAHFLDFIRALESEYDRQDTPPPF